MDIFAVGTVVPSTDVEATYALVNDPRQVAFLQHKCRIYGSPEGAIADVSTPTHLRLALEEMAVGVAKGFLRLEASPAVSASVNDLQEHTLVEEIIHELTGDKQHREGVVTWKLSSQRRDRLQIFRDLWERGYIVTFGSKFGADFLLYKDDPKHSHAVAQVVVRGYEEEFARVDVVSFCRVAKMVKKRLMFASVRSIDEGKNDEKKSRSNESDASQWTSSNITYVSLTHALLVSRQEESGDQ
ncbi:TRNA-intron endonuclease [Phytophthora megakarya]|uniref:tRNA-intron lyase n=1 Tax=Phytophthora megakarya TaxID=4795 RepID=A0A225X047_9STRA|nr:TRNA-intron endonuclease [Phytophthora megakarya]